MVALLFATALLWPQAVLAITNTLPGPAKPGLHGSLDLSGKYQRIAKRSELNGALSAQWARDSVSVFLTSQGATGRVSGAEYARSQFHHLRLRAGAGPWGGEIFAQHATDAFAPPERRSLAGVSARLETYNVDEIVFVVGLGFFYEREQVEMIRLSNYMEFEFRREPFALSVTAFFQPRLDLWRDRRALIESCAEVGLLEWLAIKGELTLIHDTRPPDDKTRFEVAASGAVALRW